LGCDRRTQSAAGPSPVAQFYYARPLSRFSGRYAARPPAITPLPHTSEWRYQRHRMTTKLQRLRRCMRAGDWRNALRLAASFPRLGEHHAVIVRAHEAGWHPDFYRAIGRDPDADIAAGIAALRARYPDDPR
jgi:hypothetical protein